MADKIQLTIEHMIPELDNLVQIGLLNKREVKKIIKKRRHYEYQFEKKDVQKSDYFKAIRYEKILNKRKNQKKNELNMKKSDYNEFHFIRRIIFLFKKCLQKFKKDESIWMEFFNFLIKHKCHNILNKEIGECLLIHPRNLTFWKIAAYNEFENNFNSITARNLFQKSIRLNQNNIETHLEYFIFELKFAEKVAERRKILLGDKETKIKFIEDEDFLSKQSLVKEVDMSHDAEEKKSEQDNTTELLKLEIPEIIWKQAHILFKHKDNSKELDIQFLGALMKYGSKLDYKGLKEKIICSLRENDSSIDTEIQIQRCLLEKYDKKDYIKKLVEKFDKLLKSNPQEYCNKFISSAFNFLESKFINERDINEIEKSNIFSYVWEKLKNQIDIEEISKNFTEDYNLRIIKFLSDHKVFKSNVLNDLINKIIDNLFTIKDATILTEFFNVWKNHIMNFNLDMDTIFDTLALKMKNVKSGNNTFYANLLFQVCELIEDEVHFSPEKTMSYLTRIEDMIFHIKDLSSKREVYKKLVKIIYTGMIKYIPKEVQSFDQVQNDLNAFIPPLEFLKQRMTKSLVNYEAIRKELLIKVDKDILNLLKRII